MSKKRVDRKVVEYTCDVCGAKTVEGEGLKDWSEIVKMIKPLRKEVTVRHVCVECSPRLEGVFEGTR